MKAEQLQARLARLPEYYGEVQEPVYELGRLIGDRLPTDGDVSPAQFWDAGLALVEDCQTGIDRRTGSPISSDESFVGADGVFIYTALLCQVPQIADRIFTPYDDAIAVWDEYRARSRFKVL